MSQANDMINQGGYSQDEVDAMYASLEDAYKALKKYNYLTQIELYLDGEAAKDFYQYDLSLLKEGISYKNAVLDLNVRLYPNDGSYQSVVWESSTTDINVTNEGECTPSGNKACYGRITCTVTDHYGNSFSDYVWVSYSYIPVTSIEMSESNISGVIGSTHQLSCKVMPDGSWASGLKRASIQDYYWESLDTSVATVDQSGLVTFVSAGATAIRAISYDGGIYGECLVSSGGDRTQLKSALDSYADVDYTQYAYEYGMAFKNAFDEGQRILTDDTCSQEQIDAATDALITAYNNLSDNPYISVESINLSYVGKAKPLTGSESDVQSGTISSSNAVSLNINSKTTKYSNYNNYNRIVITAGTQPENAMYASVDWSIDASKDISSSVSGATLSLTPSERSKGAWAIVTVSYTDHYDRTASRTFYVVMSDDTMTSFDVTDSTKTLYATDDAQQLAYTIEGSPEFKTIFWSSSDEAVITVDENGVITPIDKGTATITAKTLDGGFTDTVEVTVLTDFSTLAKKQTEYYNLIEDVKDNLTYTQESLDVLSGAVAEAKLMIDENTATQAEVNAMIDRLDEAYNSLVEYEYATGVIFNISEQENVSVVNDGFVRYKATSTYNKTISLNPSIYPEGSIYSGLTFKSSNPNITVDENGVVKNASTTANGAKITCTITNERQETYDTVIYVAFVRSGATGVSFTQELVSGAPSETAQLTTVVTNEEETVLNSSVVKDCIFTSSDESIATVNDKGIVTFVGQGDAVITATTVDGGYTATITAHTTWDTTALQAAITEAEAIDYMDYAYDYGIAFNDAYNNAVDVYKNNYASQEEINTACTALVEATSALEGNEFVSPVLSVLNNGTVVDGSEPLIVNDSSQVTLDIGINDDAMVKSVEWTCVCDDKSSYEINDDNQLVITKTADDDAPIKVTVTAVDDYDRTVEHTLWLVVTNGIINATAIEITADKEIADGKITIKGCGIGFRNFTGIKLGYVTTPENANAVSSVSYTSTSSDIVVDADGNVSITPAGRANTTVTSTVTCTVTNLDGTTASASIDLEISIR